MNTITSSEESNGIKITLTAEVSSAPSSPFYLHQLVDLKGLADADDEKDQFLDQLRHLIPAQLQQVKQALDLAFSTQLTTRLEDFPLTELQIEKIIKDNT